VLGTISFLHTKIHSLLPYSSAVVFFFFWVLLSLVCCCCCLLCEWSRASLVNYGSQLRSRLVHEICITLPSDSALLLYDLHLALHSSCAGYTGSCWIRNAGIPSSWEPYGRSIELAWSPASVTVGWLYMLLGHTWEGLFIWVPHPELTQDAAEHVTSFGWFGKSYNSVLIERFLCELHTWQLCNCWN
jgi:hypothetical protein